MLSMQIVKSRGKEIYLHRVLLPLSELVMKESNRYDAITNSERAYLPYLLWSLRLKRFDSLQDANIAAKLSSLPEDEQIELLESILKNDFMTLNQSTALDVLKQLATECNSNGDFAAITTKMLDFVAFERMQWFEVTKSFSEDLRNRLRKDDVNLGKEEVRQSLLKLELQTWLQEPDLFAKTLKQNDICKVFKLSRQDFQLLSYNLDEDNSRAKSTLLNSQDFYALNSKGNEWLVTGLVPNQGVTIIGAVAGCGKTTLAYDLAGSIIYGEEFLGELPNKTGDVLIVGSDELPCFSQDKLINRGILDGFYFLFNWEVSQWHILDESIETTLPKLVIVDSFASIHCNDPNFNESSSLAGNTVKRLEALSFKYSVPIVLIHHLSKSKDNSGVNRLRGSSAIAAACSNIIILDGQGTMKNLKQVKVRGSEPLQLELEMNPDAGSFAVVSGNHDTAQVKSLAKRLEDFFSQNDGYFGKDELLQAFPSDNFGNLYASLRRLVKQGKVKQSVLKSDRRSKVWGAAP